MAGRLLEGKVAIITGGAGGLGSGLASYLAGQGAKILVTEDGEDGATAKLSALADEVRRQGGEAVSLVGDIARMEFAEKVVATALETYGQIDALVFAHGIANEGAIFDLGEEDWGAIAAHLKGGFALTRFASIWWRQNPEHGGRVVHFTSRAGLGGDPQRAACSAALMGIVGLMRTTGTLGRYKITANCIAHDGEAGAAADSGVVAPLVAYLCSEDGAGVTHRVFTLSGRGITVWREPRWQKSIFWQEPFPDIDRLFELFDNTLGSTPIGVPDY